jgi:hypothetical protein
MLLRRSLAATSLLLAGVLLAGCNGDSSGASASDKASGSASGNPTSMPVPSGAANPFSSTMSGPEHGKPGQTLTETLTNTGRLPDAYQVIVQPADAATVVTPDVHLSPGESTPVKIKVHSTPFDVHIKSVGGGSPEVVALAVH